MKKIISVILMLIFALTMTGCSNDEKKLICTRKDEFDDITTIFITYKYSKVTDAKIIMEFTDKESAGAFKDLYSNFRNDYNIIKIDGKKVTMQYSEKQIKEDFSDKKDMKLMKATFELQGYICK